MFMLLVLAVSSSSNRCLAKAVCALILQGASSNSKMHLPCCWPRCACGAVLSMGDYSGGFLRHVLTARLCRHALHNFFVSFLFRVCCRTRAFQENEPCANALYHLLKWGKPQDTGGAQGGQ
jgi:hypothetical protein